MRVIGFLALFAFIATIWAANYAVEHWGFVSVGFGLTAPAGVYFAGLAFTLRDIVHRALGRAAVVAAILLGTALAYLISDGVTLEGGLVSLAVASAVAFLLSEFADMTVYEPLREREWVVAVVASNIVGLIVDSLLFLWLAFGSLAFLNGQIVGKAWVTLAALPIVLLLRLIPFERREVTA